MIHLFVIYFLANGHATMLRAYPTQQQCESTANDLNGPGQTGPILGIKFSCADVQAYPQDLARLLSEAQ